MKTRPYVSCLFARLVRKEALFRFENNQINETQYDDVCSKTRTQVALDALCDYAEAEGIDIYDMGQWMRTRSFQNIVDVLEAYPAVGGIPELHYTVGVQGRKARRAQGLPYNEQPEFLEDKEKYERGPEEVEETPDHWN